MRRVKRSSEIDKRVRSAYQGGRMSHQGGQLLKRIEHSVKPTLLDDAFARTAAREGRG